MNVNKKISECSLDELVKRGSIERDASQWGEYKKALQASSSRHVLEPVIGMIDRLEKGIGTAESGGEYLHALSAEEAMGDFRALCGAAENASRGGTHPMYTLKAGAEAHPKCEGDSLVFQMISAAAGAHRGRAGGDYGVRQAAEEIYARGPEAWIELEKNTELFRLGCALSQETHCGARGFDTVLSQWQDLGKKAEIVCAIYSAIQNEKVEDFKEGREVYCEYVASRLVQSDEEVYDRLFVRACTSEEGLRYRLGADVGFLQAVKKLEEKVEWVSSPADVTTAMRQVLDYATPNITALEVIDRCKESIRKKGALHVMKNGEVLRAVYIETTGGKEPVTVDRTK